MQLHRHPCGFYYSQPFADFLNQKHERESSEHPGELLALDYIRCREGSQAGNAWWQLDWISLHTVPSQNRFEIGSTEIALSRQTLKGLARHLLHYADGQVLVKK
ncbi:hypothetical protein EI77_01362 [Prosthecobacter fusiformis]|uniref:Uncharacterized protein n=1 Tax=Prosthecobacter fusiformis TaxID=48464 RepID=A0A4R7S5H2_9BACT|nr:hypothetical protein [Prosthecobacter fusiformis]TDU72896.1 hypothetical protein EI77_01362 [Prosthecobacter fusiformis]